MADSPGGTRDSDEPEWSGEGERRSDCRSGAHLYVYLHSSMRLFASQVENYKFKNAAFEAAGRVFGRMNKNTCWNTQS